MALKRVTYNNRTFYKIERVGFERCLFSESSPDHLIVPDAVKFTASQGGILQSVEEAVAFQIEADGQDNSDGHQATRTVVLYGSFNGKPLALLDDDPVQNIVKSADMCYERETKGGLFLKKDNSYVHAVIARAQKNNRVLELPGQARRGLEWKLEPEKGRAIFGSMTEPYAEFMRSKGHSEVLVYALTAAEVGRIKEELVEVRLFSLCYKNVVCAYARFGTMSRARAVLYAQK